MNSNGFKPLTNCLKGKCSIDWAKNYKKYINNRDKKKKERYIKLRERSIL